MFFVNAATTVTASMTRALTLVMILMIASLSAVAALIAYLVYNKVKQRRLNRSKSSEILLLAVIFITCKQSELQIEAIQAPDQNNPEYLQPDFEVDYDTSVKPSSAFKNVGRVVPAAEYAHIVIPIALQQLHDEAHYIISNVTHHHGQYVKFMNKVRSWRYTSEVISMAEVNHEVKLQEMKSQYLHDIVTYHKLLFRESLEGRQKRALLSTIGSFIVGSIFGLITQSRISQLQAQYSALNLKVNNIVDALQEVSQVVL